MKPERYHRVTHACGHTDGYWLDTGEEQCLPDLEERPCWKCEADTEWDVAFATWLDEEEGA